MPTSAAKLQPEVTDVLVTETALRLFLADGRELAAPLSWFPRLEHATPAQRASWRIIGRGEGVHWPDVDEDVALRTLLRAA